MMIKQVNFAISIASRIFNYVIIFTFAILLAKFVWWFFTPTVSEIYIEKPNVEAFDTVAKFIMNRSPFGVVLAPPIPPKPAIASQIKLTGVYVNTVANSIAFYELNNKNFIAKVGDKINGSAVVKSINSKGIIMSENNVDADVTLSSGSGSTVAQSLVTQPSTSVYNSYQSPVATPNQNSNQDNGNQGNNNLNQGAQNSNDSTAEARRKLIDEFMKRRGNQESTRSARDDN